MHIPRGDVELQVEGRVPDKDSQLVVYCAGGTRLALVGRRCRTLATATLPRCRGASQVEGPGRPWVTPCTPLDADQRDRYSRHLLLPEVGEAGQQSCSSPGCSSSGRGPRLPCGALPGRGRRGTLGLIDMDVVDASNLQRQILHNLDRIGDRKVDSAKKTLTGMNPDMDVVTYDARLGRQRPRHLRWLRRHHRRVRQFPTRYLVNDASL